MRKGRDFTAVPPLLIKKPLRKAAIYPLSLTQASLDRHQLVFDYGDCRTSTYAEITL